MGRLSNLVTTMLLIGVVFVLLPPIDARKLKNLDIQKKGVNINSLEDSLILNALPKGTRKPSTPSKKAHSVILDRKLSDNTPVQDDNNNDLHDVRTLASVPSPGVGH
ncbi:precursor of CEP13-like [Papaver somniferum]|uniref:precursor of CEP13-like n=1 Tax=Papaver somniferum TaxID=3469 RepID=UPI000E702157|nr:precursor of CEP13-like [Papaver somniferum]